jgi:hypothetical protein
MHGINLLPSPYQEVVDFFPKTGPFAYTAALCHWDAYASLSYGSWFTFCLSLHQLPSLFGV